MKIRTDQLDALQQQEEAKRRKQDAAEGFDQLLAEELGNQDGAQKAREVAPPPGARSMAISPLLMTEAVDETAAVTGAGAAPAEIAEQLEGVLTGWDTYTQQLGATPNADLKGAYATLEGVSGELAKLREQNPELATRHPELGAVVNELEVMAVTERFKLNRGDYV